MSVKYYPSCKFTAYLPELSEKIKTYVASKDIEIAGCCQPTLNNVREDDTAIYICNSCYAFFKESSKTNNLLSIWEVIVSDKTFSYPDYQGKVVTIQDCWRSYDNLNQQKAIRQLLENMNVKLVELEENYSKTKFCGFSIHTAMNDRLRNLAPDLYIKKANEDGRLIDHSEEEQLQLMKDYCKQITTDEVVCTCTGCLKGIKLGGKKGIHLLELLFPDE